MPRKNKSAKERAKEFAKLVVKGGTGVAFLILLARGLCVYGWGDPTCFGILPPLAQTMEAGVFADSSVFTYLILIVALLWVILKW